MEAIQTIGLTKFYGKNRGIQNLDLRVEEGEFFGFIGPNGAGKSTTIRTLLGLIRPTSGSARILGPTPLAVVKVNDRYRYRVHIACRADRNLRAALSQTVIEANTDKRFRGVSVYADNDPGD